MTARLSDAPVGVVAKASEEGLRLEFAEPVTIEPGQALRVTVKR